MVAVDPQFLEELEALDPVLRVREQPKPQPPNDIPVITVSGNPLHSKLLLLYGYSAY
jgi:hypothetical protein